MIEHTTFKVHAQEEVATITKLHAQNLAILKAYIAQACIVQYCRAEIAVVEVAINEVPAGENSVGKITARELAILVIARR